MPKFVYSAKDKESHSINGTMDAQDKAAVIQELRKNNLTIIDVVLEDSQKKAASVARSSHSKGKVKPMDLVVLSRQLATLIDSGISLTAGLNILRDQIENPYLKKIVVNIKSDIEAGNSLSASFAKYPEAFPSIFENMIKAGESSGSLNEILERVADYLERTENLRRKITSSLTYPILILSMAGIIVGFLLLKVVPTFKSIFTSLGGTLPAPTQMLVFMSDTGVKFFPFVVAGFVIIYMSFIKYVNTTKGRIKFDAFKLDMPVFGPIAKKIAISKFARTLATLVKSGVSILEAFEIAGKVSGNKVIEIATEQIRTNMRAGETISTPMEQTGKFPPFVVKMIAVGEQTGELEKMLTKISDYYEVQVSDSLSELTSLIEPLVISFMGVTIGFIVVAMFMPIFNLTSLINK